MVSFSNPLHSGFKHACENQIRSRVEFTASSAFRLPRDVGGKLAVVAASGATLDFPPKKGKGATGAGVSLMCSPVPGPDRAGA